MKRLLTVIILLLVLVGFGFIYWTLGNQPVNPKDTSSKIFVINRGEAVREIGNSLKKEGLIKDPVVFFIYIKLHADDKNVQAGDYKLSPSMSLSKVVDSLKHGSLDIWVTVPEGLRAEEIADLLQKNLPSYDESWRQTLVANEGYLFPDTYLIPRDATVDQVITMMKNTFDKRIEDSKIDVSALELKQAVIIASIIEKEALFPEDYPLVSSVIHNRLEDGMKLQVDPSVAYALGRQSNGKWGKAELTFDDLEVNSPYNTYAHVGLPPGQISNPGIQAIQAALNPLKTDYFFYISDKQGHIHPAKDESGHAANIKKYL